MGYTTDFEGSLKLSKELTPEQKVYINTFSGTRRMKRDVNKLMELYGGKFGYPQTESNLLPISEKIYGKDGEFFVKDDGDMGQRGDASVIDHNTPPGQLGYNESTLSFEQRWSENQRREKEGECQPSLWCQWVINDENELEWDGGVKFYSYVEWLKYLIKNFFQPWGVLLNGEIEWTGEDSSDMGKIVVVNNEVTTKHGTVVYN
jgi:hypothetical protein